MREIVKAFQVMDLRITNGFLFNALDQAFQDTDAHPHLLHADRGEKAREKIHVDLDVLQPLGRFLSPLPQLVNVLLEVFEL